MRGGCTNIQGGVYIYLRGCTFITALNNLYLNFTSSSANGTNGNSSTGSGTVMANGAVRGVETGVWGLTLPVGIAVSVLMG
jgi:hypothetical protein